MGPLSSPHGGLRAARQLPVGVERAAPPVEPLTDAVVDERGHGGRDRLAGAAAAIRSVGSRLPLGHLLRLVEHQPFGLEIVRQRNLNPRVHNPDRLPVVFPAASQALRILALPQHRYAPPTTRTTLWLPVGHSETALRPAGCKSVRVSRARVIPTYIVR